MNPDFEAFLKNVPTYFQIGRAFHEGMRLGEEVPLGVSVEELQKVCTEQGVNLTKKVLSKGSVYTVHKEPEPTLLYHPHIWVKEDDSLWIREEDLYKLRSQLLGERIVEASDYEDVYTETLKDFPDIPVIKMDGEALHSDFEEQFPLWVDDGVDWDEFFEGFEDGVLDLELYSFLDNKLRRNGVIKEHELLHPRAAYNSESRMLRVEINGERVVFWDFRDLLVSDTVGISVAQDPDFAKSLMGDKQL